MSLFIISTFFVACNNDLKEEVAISEKSKAKLAQQKTDKVADAIDFLNEAFVDDTMPSVAPGTTPQTVSFTKSKIDTIYDLPDENKKPFLKLVVFKPKAYALVSVIKNVPNPPVLYYSANKFDKKNPSIGLITYLQQFFATAARSYAVPADDDIGPGKSFSFYYKTLSTTTIKKEVLPFLNTYWYQGSPYNNTIKKNKGHNYVAGCVAVAVGQIMAYHKKNILKSYNWSKIHQNNLDDETTTTPISDLLYDIGQGVKMKYGLSVSGGSGASNDDAETYLKNAGYTTCFTGYQYYKVVDELKQKRPVYLSGAITRTYNGFWANLWVNLFGSGFINVRRYSYDGGHAWVCDGYREVTVTQIIKKDTYDNLNQRIADSDTYTKSSTKKYLHMNWGWGDDYSKNKINSNGWCTYNYWREKTGRTFKGKLLNFKYNQKIITIRP